MLLCPHLQTFKPTDAQNSKSEEQDKSFPQVPGHDIINCLFGYFEIPETQQESLCGGGCDGGGCVAAGGGGLCVWCACIVFESSFSLPINTNIMFWLSIVTSQAGF